MPHLGAPANLQVGAIGKLFFEPLTLLPHGILHVGLLYPGFTGKSQIHAIEDPRCLPSLQGLSIDVIYVLPSAPEEQVGRCTCLAFPDVHLSVLKEADEGDDASARSHADQRGLRLVCRQVKH